jgi:hypothetical protein
MEKKLLWPYSLLALSANRSCRYDEYGNGASEVGDAASSRRVARDHSYTDTHHVQIWRLSDLRLLATVDLPARSSGKSNLNPAEPRLLPDGSVYVNTFNCGLFRLTGLEGTTPKAESVWEFPGASSKEECAVPVVIGKYWIQTDPSLPGLVTLDYKRSGENRSRHLD